MSEGGREESGIVFGTTDGHCIAKPSKLEIFIDFHQKFLEKF